MSVETIEDIVVFGVVNFAAGPLVMTATIQPRLDALAKTTWDNTRSGHMNAFSTQITLGRRQLTLAPVRHTAVAQSPISYRRWRRRHVGIDHTRQLGMIFTDF